MNDDIEKTADNRSHDPEEHAGEWQRHIQRPIYRRHVHSAIHCSVAPDLMPTDFFGGMELRSLPAGFSPSPVGRRAGDEGLAWLNYYSNYLREMSSRCELISRIS